MLTFLLWAACQYHTHLEWRPPTSKNVVGYNVYRRLASDKDYQKINPYLVKDTDYNDPLPCFIRANYYVTSVDKKGRESKPSNYFTVAKP